MSDDEKPPTRLVILGKQGAGKGTQADRVARRYGIPHISTGEILRTAVRAGTEAGSKAQRYMEAGDLVPDEVVTEIVKERLEADDVNGKGYLLDGFPRNVAQADILDNMLGRDGIDLVLELVVPTQVVLRRLAGRRVCVDCGTNYSVSEPPKENWTCDRCGGKVVQRDDDTEAAILRRLDLYKQETEPLVGYYLAHDKLAAVDGTGPPDTVTARLFRAIDSRLHRNPPQESN